MVKMKKKEKKFCVQVVGVNGQGNQIQLSELWVIRVEHKQTYYAVVAVYFCYASL